MQPESVEIIRCRLRRIRALLQRQNGVVRRIPFATQRANLAQALHHVRVHERKTHGQQCQRFAYGAQPRRNRPRMNVREAVALFAKDDATPGSALWIVGENRRVVVAAVQVDQPEAPINPAESGRELGGFVPADELATRAKWR